MPDCNINQIKINFALKANITHFNIHKITFLFNTECEQLVSIFALQKLLIYFFQKLEKSGGTWFDH